ncbi:MAG: nitrile hydratase accessory protein [Pseudomonadota bacterium]
MSRPAPAVDAPPDPPVFEAPWHGEVFALTVHLQAQGRFTWPEWTARFGAALAEAGEGTSLDGGDDYFSVWVSALESLLAEDGSAPLSEQARLRAAWEQAYLSTPHGAPVRLPEAGPPEPER